MTMSNQSLRSPARPSRDTDAMQPATFFTQVMRLSQGAGDAAERMERHRSSPLRRQPSDAGRRMSLVGSRLFDTSRTVVVKARAVRHRGRSCRLAALAKHIAYLKWEGVSENGNAARMFDAFTDAANERDFAERCDGDRVYFRFIITPEDARQMSDLKAFCRDLFADLEHHLGTWLDWIAVNHWNTETPHIHVLVRGKTDDGGELVISRDNIFRWMRPRAEALVAIELGRKSEHEVRAVLEREVDAERWTRLDIVLRRHAEASGMVDLQSAGECDARIHRLLVGRLQRLQRLGVAASVGLNRWVMAAGAEATLRELGMRAEMFKTMHRAMMELGTARPVRDYAVHERVPPSIIGRLVAKGLHDELTEEAYAIVDGVDGRVHHIRFDDTETLEAAPVGGIVEVHRFGAAESSQLRLALTVLSDLAIAAQVDASGATWLDCQFVACERAELSEEGFGQEVRQALCARIDYLVAQGLALRQGHRIIFASNLLDTLRKREVDAGTPVTLGTVIAYRSSAQDKIVVGVFGERSDAAVERVEIGR